jgi:hypothetical protein
MSMIDAHKSDLIDATPRRPLTTSERRSILERQAHICPACKGSLRFEIDGQAMLVPMIDEHIIPLGLAPTNSPSGGGWRARSDRSRRSGRGGLSGTPCIGKMHEVAHLISHRRYAGQAIHTARTGEI